jgi:transposase
MAKPGLRKVFKYSEEFKATAVALSRMQGVAVQDVAAELDIHPFMLSLWRRQIRTQILFVPCFVDVDASRIICCNSLKAAHL